jgi:site-specific DNA-cytosine methylase
MRPVGIRGAPKNPRRSHIYTYKTAGLFGGGGGGKRGFRNAKNPTARFRVIGSIDNDPAACRDFERLVGVPQACLDLFTTEQWIAFHSEYDKQGVMTKRAELPEGWAEVTIPQFRAAFNDETPNSAFTSSPCQGLSGLLSNAKAALPKYGALNELTIRGLFLAMEAWGDDPPEFILFENVPRIHTRGRPLLVQIVALLDHYGYAVQETIHDCGELGGLAQHRKRFFMVARHRDKVKPFLYVPPKKRVRAIREVLWDKPLPGDLVNGGKMHGMIKAQWKTWVRLALIRKGKDWRDLKNSVGKYVIRQLRDDEVVVMGPAGVEVPRMGQHKHMRMYDDAEPSGTITGTNDIRSGSLLVADTRLAREHVYRVEPAADRAPYVLDGALALQKRRGHNNVFVVLGAEHAAPAVNGGGGPSSGAASVADDRIVTGNWGDYHAYGVADPDGPSETVTAKAGPGSGEFSTADPRPARPYFGQSFGVADADGPALTVTGRTSPSNGEFSVADPRPTAEYHHNSYGVADPGKPANTVTGRGAPTCGEFSVADDRILTGLDPNKKSFINGGHYGVQDPDTPSGAVTARGKHDNGRFSLADDRLEEILSELPAPKDVLDPWPIIIAPDGTVHRPMTAAELAWLQSFPTHFDDGSVFELDGNSSAAWRTRIGNAVPPLAAQAIGESILRTLELNRMGVGFRLSNEAIWVHPQELRVEEQQRREARETVARLRYELQ